MSSCARLSKSRAEESLFWKGSRVGQLWFWAAMGSRMGVFSMVAPAATDATVVRHDFPLPCWDMPTCSTLGFVCEPTSPSFHREKA